MGLEDITDQDLLHEVTVRGEDLLNSARHRLATVHLSDIKGWGDAPMPLRFELQVCVLLLGALDAYGVTAGILHERQSQQAFSGVRFLVESVALLRWLAAREDPAERQLRSYRLMNRSIALQVKYLTKDAAGDPQALQGVERVKQWHDLLHQLAQRDGIPTLKEPPDRTKLLTDFGPPSGPAIFDMLSELGSHPGFAGLLLFALSDSVGSEIRYDLSSAIIPRAHWSSMALVHVWQACEPAAKAFGGRTGSRRRHNPSTSRRPESSQRWSTVTSSPEPS